MTCYGPRPKYLDFSTIKFSAIPQDIGNYSFSISQSILHSLCNASNIQVLNLSINKIYGTIPTCLMIMTSIIEAINLSRKKSHWLHTRCVFSFLCCKDFELPSKSLSHCLSLNVRTFYVF